MQKSHEKTVQSATACTGLHAPTLLTLTAVIGIRPCGTVDIPAGRNARSIRSAAGSDLPTESHYTSPRTSCLYSRDGTRVCRRSTRVVFHDHRRCCTSRSRNAIPLLDQMNPLPAIHQKNLTRLVCLPSRAAVAVAFAWSPYVGVAPVALELFTSTAQRQRKDKQPEGKDKQRRKRSHKIMTTKANQSKAISFKNDSGDRRV